ncbi:glycosylhydrolase-like jelly roll fold domain-containing protein [Flagellimonas sp. CMM7]
MLPAYEQKGEVTAVPLKLAPYESVFVVFTQDADQGPGSDELLNFPKAQLVVDLNENWTVQFNPAQRGPEAPVTFDKLIDWTTSEDENIKYYSGQATYTKPFELDELKDGERMILDLGKLTAIARVFVNGQIAGGVWTAPYKLDVTDLVRLGTNELKIEVINNWMNRLIGDAGMPKEEQPTWAPHNTYTSESELQPSGLFGPVSLGTIPE